MTTYKALCGQSDPDNGGLMTINQIASRWQVSTETVERRIRRGELPALKLGRCVRIRPAALAQYEQAHRFANEQHTNRK